jgi:hypothetical protein
MMSNFVRAISLRNHDVNVFPRYHSMFSVVCESTIHSASFTPCVFNDVVDIKMACKVDDTSIP